MTHAELIAACKSFEQEHGVGALIKLLSDTVIEAAQWNGLDVEYVDDGEDEDGVEVYTVQ